MSKDYEVGYGKPPKHTQFKKGECRNGKGRPRKKRTFQEEVEEVFSAKIEVTLNGEKTQTSRLRLILEQIANLAARGNPSMIRLAIPMMKELDGAPDFEVLPEDKAVLDRLLGKYDTSVGGGDGANG